MGKAKRKRVTLKKSIAVQRLDQILPLIEENVRIAIDVESSLEEANAVIRSLTKKKFYGANCYNVVRQCLALELAITVARLFDSGRKRSKKNKSDVAGIPLCVHFLKQRRCRNVLLERARHWTPGLHYSAEMNADDCAKEIDNALNAYSSLVRSPGGKKALGALKQFRDAKLAHTLMGKLLKDLPRYDDLFLLVEVARNFVGHAKLAVAGTNISFVEIGRIRREEAEFFWRAAIEGAIAADKGMSQ